MKKLLSAAVLFFLLSSTAAFATPEQREQYREIPGLVSAYTYEDGECFLDADSSSADDYNPPRYEISATTYFITDTSPEVVTRSIRFRYNYDKQTIFLNGTDGKWYWLNPDENPISLCQIILADLMFQQCYHVPFLR